MRRLAWFVALTMAGALAGCGSTPELRPAAGRTLPVKPYGAIAVPTATQLLAPTPQQRPQRSADLAPSQTIRPADGFDLPPPDKKP